MVTNTSQKIIDYLQTYKQAKAAELIRVLGITNSAVHRQLNKLLEKGEIIKVGKPPVVFYLIKQKESEVTITIPDSIEEFINKNYIYVSPVGEYLTGSVGFVSWVKSIHQEKYMLPLAHEYVKVRNDADKFITSQGWIDATQAKEVATFQDTLLDKMLYADFYSIEKFGKTKLGQMVLYAKISQNLSIMNAIVEQIKPVVHKIIEKYQIDTVAFIPPSIKRNIQLMSELKTRLHLQLPEISLVKAYAGEVVVSQKSLSKFQERVINAQNTIFIDVNKSVRQPDNVLIIDDAVGSGATLHETAKKIKELLTPHGKIIGFAIVGSIKGFEVIREI